MAKQTVVNCDVCGESDARSFRISVDDEHWEVDLCEKHGKPVLTAASKGRQVNVGGVRDSKARFRALEARIEGVPDE